MTYYIYMPLIEVPFSVTFVTQFCNRSDIYTVFCRSVANCHMYVLAALAQVHIYILENYIHSCSLILTTLKYFYINHRDQRFFNLKSP